ncbi:DNA cytosine methyltransferase, partial [Desulfovibrio sp. OttesenSCG-928-G15]|nr:DNA cytosine methyltransferase [Desulfovibrio sp. OttesenSCG-928-G15]
MTTTSVMTFVDFFAGIGGFSLGFIHAGCKCLYQVEKNEQCLSVLNKKFPNIPKHRDVRTWADTCGLYADVFTFGDPCPKHSRARSNGASKHPDMSGYCLALAGRFQPWGVVRENVPASTVSHFSAALEAIGYGTVVIRMDAASYTGQSRQRDFIVGLRQEAGSSVRSLFPEFSDGAGAYTTQLGTRQVIPALTTHRTRYDSRDCYIWEEKFKKLRILDAEEREAFAGFPRGWTDG